ncbi:MAG: hypothetical protein VX852_03415 [Candidatus Neomarinimicrobiota bacterium]|nr:hypothetical protein [Candidatus Neomarinimicrobiota bacterium]|tara:strand:+ start:349 stop:846 length:498 start_codon:yes stop_codon:yes gene_type:complete
MRNISLSFILVAILLFVGCAPGASDRTTAVKRAIETREYNVDTKTLMSASVGAFQDLGYTIDVLNSDYGLITGSRTQGTQTIENDSSILEGIMSGLFGLDNRSDDILIMPLKLSATITVKEVSSDPLISSLRVNFESGGKKYSDLFFRSFFAAIDQSLFLQTETE